MSAARSRRVTLFTLVAVAYVLGAELSWHSFGSAWPSASGRGLGRGGPAADSPAAVPSAVHALCVTGPGCETTSRWKAPTGHAAGVALPAESATVWSGARRCR